LLEIRRVYILKLVLLPGMDGTGELFADLLSHFEGEHMVIPLPQNGEQDHTSLAKVINHQLPPEDFILLAESFSGGIVPELLRLENKQIKGVIFIASFLSSPKKYLLSIARLLPIKSLTSAPLSRIAHKLLFLGQEASNELLTKFEEVVKSIPNSVLKNRLGIMQRQELPITTFDLPVAYIRALSDRLISDKKGREFSQIFTNIKHIEIEGPHFILQAKPKESASLIEKLIQTGEL